MSTAGGDDGTADDEREGYLFKRSHNIRRDWSVFGFDRVFQSISVLPIRKTRKRRYFVLRDGFLQYSSESGGGGGEAVRLPLQLCTVRDNKDADRRFCFEVLSLVSVVFQFLC